MNREREYRADINGLRAVAVILVLLFHLECSGVKAGFLGVDVFLVISGYLISRNILNDLEKKQFILKKFYARRFKRLFPALFVTLALSLVAGVVILTPANLVQLSKTVVSGVFFFSNIFFLSEVGYFDIESAYKPLLHIWSLSLEEQFYFVWPLLLVLIFKLFREALFFFVLILIIISIYFANVYIKSYPEATFYLLPFRFFEFLLGALCIWLERFKPKSKIFVELSLLMGLVLICYSATQFTVSTPMPGILSLVPCVGAMLIICAGNTQYSGWLFRNKVLEIIGKSSYSVYLIHWPLIVYYKYYTLSELTDANRVVLCIVSLLLGFLMWKYVENTFRRSELKLWKIDALWIWMPALMLLILVISHNIWSNKGYPLRYANVITMTEADIRANENRYWQDADSVRDILQETKGSDSVEDIVRGKKGLDPVRDTLQETNNKKIVDQGNLSRYYTMTGNDILAKRDKYWRGLDSIRDAIQETDKKKIIVMGNSFAVDLIYALKQNKMKAKIISLQTHHKCFNFGTVPVNEVDTLLCSQVKLKNFADANWATADAIYLFDHWPKLDLIKLKELLIDIRNISNAPIYVFGPKMIFSKPIPDIVHACKSASTYAINKFAQDFAEIKDRTEVNTALIKFFEDEYWKKNKMFYINVLKILGNGENKFDIVSPKTSDFIYFDQNHFTEQGSKEFGEKLKKAHPELF